MRILTTICFVQLQCILFAQGVRYVESVGVDTGNCDNPDYPCMTISYAVLQAESGDTILISEGIFTEPDGIIIEKSIVLLGAGDSVTIIQAHEEPEMATSRVITVEGAFRVTISGTTIRHGYANKADTGSSGGGIYCDSAFLTLIKVRLNKNFAEFSGGGLACFSSTTTMTTVVFDDNTAYAQSGRGGGGLYMSSSTGNFDNLDFINNSASIGLGGGAYLFGTSYEIDSSRFTQNKASLGGGIFVRAGSSAFLTNCIVSDNTTRVSGGGIYTTADSLFLNNVLISGNYGDATGGGIYIASGYADLKNLSIRVNRAQNGGGIYNKSSLSRFADVKVDSNMTFQFGGGMFHDMDVPYTLTGISFRNNEAYARGGGLYSSGDSLFIQYVDFEYNQAKYGGGLYLSGLAHVEHSTFFRNNATDSGGGMNFLGQVYLSNISFIENTAQQGGGGLSSSSVFSEELYPQLSGIIFRGNSARGGGGMINGPYSYPTLQSVIFDSNSAESGGGFYNSFGTPTFYNTLFNYNTADFGGGLYNSRDTVTTINTLFYRNVSYFAGGAIFNSGNDHLPLDEGKIQLTNVTMSQNSSPLGGGVYSENNGRLTALNTIIWNNTSDAGKDIYNDSSSIGSLKFSLCSESMTDIVPGKGIELVQCVHTDPLFVNADINDYRLKSASPAIDRGDPATSTGIFPGGPENPLDYDLNSRFKGSSIDLGAFEWQGFVSLENSEPDAMMSVYPNPASNSIFIMSNEAIDRITLYNLTGQIVFEDLEVDSLERNINISSLIDGLYIGCISLGKSHFTFRILKEGF